MAVHKNPATTETQKKTEVQSDKKIDQEAVVVSDVVTETTERIEVVEEVSAPQTPSDPLSDFKEKMVEEESSIRDDVPNKNYVWPILLIFVIAILLLVGVFLYKNGGIAIKDKINIVTLSPTPTIVSEPTKTIDLTKYEIEVLNGGGVSGEALRQKLSLTAEGFTISSIGNADNSDYTDTIIKAKAEVDKAFLDKLSSVLGDTFTLGETEALSDDSSSPVVIILGTVK